MLNWLNGKKTIIGAVIMFLAYGAHGMGWLNDPMFSWVSNLAEAVLGVGLVHKAVKQMANG